MGAPTGGTSEITKSPSKVWVMFTLTFTSSTVLLSGTTMDIEAPAGLLSGMGTGGLELG